MLVTIEMPRPSADVPLDDLPASRLEGHAVIQAVLVEDVIDHAPGGQVLGGKDQGKLGHVLDGHAWTSRPEDGPWPRSAWGRSGTWGCS